MAEFYDRLFDPDSANARISDLWWAVALKGVSALVLGMLAVLWPAITLLTLALIFAAYCVVDAVFSIILAVRGARRHQRWWWSALNAVIALAAAAVAMLYPNLTILVFVIMLAAWALVNGVVSIIAAFRLKTDHGRWWLVITGVVSVVLGALLIALPGIGLFTLTWMIAFQSWLAAGALLGLAYRLRLRRSERIASDETARSERRASSAPAA